MIRTLVSVRLRAMFAGLTRQARQKNKKSMGMTALFAVLYIYLIVVVGGMMCLTFSSLAPVYSALDLGWLYFAVAGIMALGLSVFGSVFTTQSQLYDAKDNDLLLSMPIRPGAILLSRMIPLLGMNLLFGGIVMIPAAVMWAILVEFDLWNFILQMLGLLAVCFLAQAVACLLGWGMHLLLQRMNKSLASLLYMVLFLGAYFGVYSQMGDIMTTMVTGGEAIAEILQCWAWPVYALGMGCLGGLGYLAGFIAICAGAFGVVYWVLDRTFLRSAVSRRSVRRGRLDMNAVKAGTATQAIVSKEWQHFLGSPVYLTNMGVGILLTVAMAVMGVLLRSQLLELLREYAALGLDLTAYIPLVICGGISFLVSTMAVSAPSVSLEGKNLWILKSMPLSGKTVLLSKLRFHLILTTPVTMLAGLVLSVVYGCGWADAVLCALVPGLLTVVGGELGLVCGLRWARLDWLSEAYPCKQGAAVGITMFSMMGLPVALGLGYFLLMEYLSTTLFLTLCALILTAIAAALYRVLTTWGVKKWNAL